MEAEVKTAKSLLVSMMAENLMSSQILRIASEINEKIAAGEKIYNLTIGDFNPKIFPIPQSLKAEIGKAFEKDLTNYPPVNGLPALRKAISAFTLNKFGIECDPEDIVVGSGARPLVFASYLTLLDKGDTVIYPVPSWNNEYYCHISHAKHVVIETKPQNNFMPVAGEIKPSIKEANLIALCSPLNPSGTAFTEDELADICSLVLEENYRRGESKKPVYILFDQVYALLTYNGIRHYDPVSLFPEMKDYTIYIDSISKSFAATGVRVGWAFGPPRVINKMKAVLSHMGAFAPTPLQAAAAEFLNDDESASDFLADFCCELSMRLEAFYERFEALKKKGLPVHAIAPQAAIYLTIKLELLGMKTPGGKMLERSSDITRYLIDEAKVALVPFSAFGASQAEEWFRLSVGTCRLEDVNGAMENIESALSKLT
jgi:aspartate aminotransferase